MRNHAVHFLKMIIAGKIDQAFQRYAHPKGKHHNPFFPKGFPAIANGMKENHLQFPKKIFSIKHVIQEGNVVAVHSHLRFKPDEPGMITVHLFRFKNGKIAELWDCGQAIPKNSPNKDGAF